MNRRAATMVVLLTMLLAGLRIAVLFATPLQLYPDEAQYWLWSRDLAFGYVSKPPMIAWAIHATTALGGDGEAWVRLAAPLFQAGAGLCAYVLGRRFYGPWAGLAGAGLYMLAPAVQLSALVAATDAPLLFFSGLALVAYAAVPTAEAGRKLAPAAGLGVVLGLAFLSKYAAAYLVAGGLLHLAVSPAARRGWTPAAAAMALCAGAAVLAPNLAWNAAHDFATVEHTAAAADWSRRGWGGPLRLLRFLGEQVMIFGPIPGVALLLAAGAAVRRRRLDEPERMLACFVAAPLVIVAAQALISRANANWAAAAYLPAAVLAGGLLARTGARRWLAAAVAVQAAAALLFLAVAVSPSLAAALNADNSFKRVRGWREAADAVLARADAEQRRGGVSAVATDNRFLFQALAYYGRDWFAAPGRPPLRAWLAEAQPRTQAELAAPLTVRDGRRVLVASYEGWRAADVRGDFRESSPEHVASILLDPRHRRRIVMFVGEGLAPAPRPLNARATPP